MMIPRHTAAALVLSFMAAAAASCLTVCSAFTVSCQTAAVAARYNCQETAEAWVIFANKDNKDNSSNNKDNEDEGPAYTGRGGMGQPKGTVNTYIIEGMDEMTPAEYQAALQESVLERQRQRQRSGTTAIGNKATWDYLNALEQGGGGTTTGGGGGGVLKRNNDDEMKKNFAPWKPPSK